MRESLARIAIDGVEVETAVQGSGDPVALVPTALVADHLLPLAERLQDRFRVVHYHRRGYAGSSAATPPGSVARDAADCARLLTALAIEKVHVLGVSYSTAVALQMAVDHPHVVHTLTLVEPPPVHGRGDASFRSANAELLSHRQAEGAQAAVERFLLTTVGPDWREQIDRAVPGSSAQALRDSRTFLDVDIPALLDWPFDTPTATRVRCPVLHVAGGEHGPLFSGVDQLIRTWLPDADQVTITGAGHDIAMTHPDALIDVVVPFLARHPVGRPSRPPPPGHSHPEWIQRCARRPGESTSPLAGPGQAAAETIGRPAVAGTPAAPSTPRARTSMSSACPPPQAARRGGERVAVPPR